MSLLYYTVSIPEIVAVPDVWNSFNSGKFRKGDTCRLLESDSLSELVPLF